MKARPGRLALTTGFALLAYLAWHVAKTARDPAGPAPPDGFEALRARSSYGTSRSCLPCHADHGESWGRTFHRTMTQDATPQAIKAPFDGRAVDAMGVRSHPRREGAAFYLDMPDPGAGRLVAHRIDRVTGSRRMQQFETKLDDRYVRLPIAWSIEEDRWLHLSEAFFHPETADFHAHRAVWDLNCIFCHTTDPAPGLDRNDRLASRTAELGIACEACHGPGEEHARRMRSPVRRYAMRYAEVEDPSIVNPSRLDKVRSVQVCGHCHGQRLPVDRDAIRDILSGGDPYTPGEDLSRHFEPVTAESTLGEFSFAPRFWGDGSPRLTAYEYQGMLRSPCYLRGPMTCLSCHTMHAGDPRGQLRPDRAGDAMCTQCHDAFAGERLARHTRHSADGPGSRCIACHMPPVVYGIMTWHPSHQISSPDPKSASRTGTPDACTVCHSGRSRAWAAGAGGARDQVPELAHALFAGDALYRALAAARFGEPSPDPHASEAAVPLLAQLLVDPYPNVRRTARESLVRITGRTDIPRAWDPEASRDAVRRQLESDVARLTPPAGWPFTADGVLDRKRLAEWRDERREEEISIGE